MAAEGQHIRAFLFMNQRDNKGLVVVPGSQDRILRIEDLNGAG